MQVQRPHRTVTGFADHTIHNSCCYPQHSLTHSLVLLAPPVTPCLTHTRKVDSLLPTLTCRETLNFAEQCCGSSGHMGEAVVQMMSWEEAHKPERCPMDDEVGMLRSSISQPVSESAVDKK